MWAALIHINGIGPIDDEVDFLNSWHSNVELVSVEDYNRRFAKYGVHLDVSSVPDTPSGRMEGPAWARSVTLNKLTIVKAEKRRCASRLVKIAAIAAVVAALLFELGL